MLHSLILRIGNYLLAVVGSTTKLSPAATTAVITAAVQKLVIWIAYFRSFHTTAPNLLHLICQPINLSQRGLRVYAARSYG